ncbi:LysR family transcriptional regulator [Metapseudomonas furukawaii]|uniref:Transcriptional regulator n=1 Tax=Metapseudomonas furukawaii TaxID=1149133 RepID=A0AAD1BXT4_METFU|nr:LysR family transcriptional regulator [Pseudomonas furukawaii]ELS27632.1 Transcriptional regulator [Pseudomonas furukawaii]BAU71814.1 transcriptional regulator [Pseudomonas furukawaii]
MLLANALRKIDFQDLLVFLEICERQHLGEVAEALNLSASSVSYSLKKLRGCFDDELFIATRSGMRPTRKALAMRPQVRTMVEMMNGCHGDQGAFDPCQAPRTFRLCAPEYFELLILPALLRRLNDAGYPVSLDVQRLGRDIPAEALVQGGLDLALGFGPNLHRAHPALMSLALLKDELLCIRDAASAPVNDLDDFCARRQVFPTPWNSERNMIDGWLQEQGRARQIAARTNNYLAALQLIPHSDLLLVLPERVYERLGDARTARSPLPGLPSFSLEMLWAQPFDQDPANLWLREQILSVCAEQSLL